MKKIVLVSLALLALSGCSNLKDDAFYLSCLARDNTSRPCNYSGTISGPSFSLNGLYIFD